MRLRKLIEEGKIILLTGFSVAERVLQIHYCSGNTSNNEDVRKPKRIHYFIPIDHPRIQENTAYDPWTYERVLRDLVQRAQKIPKAGSGVPFEAFKSIVDITENHAFDLGRLYPKYDREKVIQNLHHLLAAFMHAHEQPSFWEMNAALSFAVRVEQAGYGDCKPFCDRAQYSDPDALVLAEVIRSRLPQASEISTKLQGKSETMSKIESFAGHEAMWTFNQYQQKSQKSWPKRGSAHYSTHSSQLSDVGSTPCDTVLGAQSDLKKRLTRDSVNRIAYVLRLAFRQRKEDVDILFSASPIPQLEGPEKYDFKSADSRMREYAGLVVVDPCNEASLSYKELDKRVLLAEASAPVGTVKHSLCRNYRNLRAYMPFIKDLSALSAALKLLEDGIADILLREDAYASLVVALHGGAHDMSEPVESYEASIKALEERGISQGQFKECAPHFRAILAVQQGINMHNSIPDGPISVGFPLPHVDNAVRSSERESSALQSYPSSSAKSFRKRPADDHALTTRPEKKKNRLDYPHDEGPSNSRGGMARGDTSPPSPLTSSSLQPGPSNSFNAGRGGTAHGNTSRSLLTSSSSRPPPPADWGQTYENYRREGGREGRSDQKRRHDYHSGREDRDDQRREDSYSRRGGRRGHH